MPQLDDRARVGISSSVQIGEPDMMRAAVNPVDDAKGRAFQLIIKPARHQAADYGRGFGFTS
jgi:hypothetical protein